MVNTDNAVSKPYFDFKIVALELDTIFHLFANTMSKYTSLTMSRTISEILIHDIFHLDARAAE